MHVITGRLVVTARPRGLGRWMKGEGRGVDALWWSEEKLAVNRSQLVAASNANDVLLCMLDLVFSSFVFGSVVLWYLDTQ